MKSNFAANKTLASFCLLILVLVPLISACKSNIGPSSSSTSDNKGPVDLTLWTVPSASEVGNPPSNWFLTKDVHDKLNINLKVTLLPVGDDGDTKMNAAAAANDLPDFFQVPSNNNIFLQWVKQGLIAPVDSLLPMMPGRTKDRYSDPQMQKIATINGKQYVLQEKTVLNKRQGLLIRKDWLNKLGLKEPKTLDDLLKVAEAFTRNDPDGDGKNDTYGFAATTGVSSPGLGGGWQAFFGAYGLPGVWNLNDPGKVSLSLRDPNYLKVVQFLRKMADEKLIDPAWPTLNTNDFRAGWKQQGKYGIISEDFCAGMCQANYQSFDTNFPQGIWEPLAPPQGPNGQSFLGASNNVGLRIAVSKKALDEGKGPAIAKFLEWTNTGDGYYETAFGQKGVNYTFDAQGNVTGQGVPVPFASHEAAPINQIRNLVYKNTPAELRPGTIALKPKTAGPSIRSRSTTPLPPIPGRIRRPRLSSNQPLTRQTSTAM